MRGNPTDITTGEYTAAGRRYVARPANGQLRLHRVNRKGEVTRNVVAIVTDGIAKPTNNGRPHEAAIAAINADPAGTRVAAHCDDCHREITDPTSVRLGRGRTCAKKHGKAASPPPSSPRRTGALSVAYKARASPVQAWRRTDRNHAQATPNLRDCWQR